MVACPPALLLLASRRVVLIMMSFLRHLQFQRFLRNLIWLWRFKTEADMTQHGKRSGIGARDIPYVLLGSCVVFMIGATYIFFLFRMSTTAETEGAQEKLKGVVREITRLELGRVVDVWASERKEDVTQRQELLETLNDLKKLVKQQRLEIDQLKGATNKVPEKLTWHKLKQLPSAVVQEVDRVASKLTQRPKLMRMFKKCFVNTLETTTEILSDGTTHVITGDIPAMWLRDSSAQVFTFSLRQHT